MEPATHEGRGGLPDASSRNRGDGTAPRRASAEHERIVKDEPVRFEALVSLVPGDQPVPLVLEIEELRARIALPESAVPLIRRRLSLDEPKSRAKPAGGGGARLKPERVQ